MLLTVSLLLFLAAVLIALIWPLLKPPPADPDRQDITVTLFRDQLAEIGRDQAAGLMTAVEAAAATTELERRLLLATSTGSKVGGVSSKGGWIAYAAVAVLVPLVVIPLYLYLGAPDLADQPFAARTQERALVGSDGNLDLNKARAALAEKLQQVPDSLEGWLLLGRTDGSLGRSADMRHDFEQALTLSKRRADVVEAYAEALVAEAQGEVTPEARALFNEAIKAAPSTAFNARYGLALARAQDGDLDGAIADWQKLAADAPADAAWLPAVQRAIAAAERQKAGPSVAAPGPATAPPAEVAAIAKLPAGERLNAIRGMVAGLAAKLEQNPGDLDGWKRLGHSYLVLGERDKAADAYGKAAGLAPQDLEVALARAQALRGDDDSVPPAAIEAYGKVNALSPDQPEALFFLGLAAKQRGDIADARARWTRLEGLLPSGSEQAQEVAKQLSALSK